MGGPARWRWRRPAGRARSARSRSPASSTGWSCTDSEGRPLRPAILWNDTRSAPEARELGEALGGPAEWAERIGLVPVASFTATRWEWLRRNEPGTAAAARAVRLPHDFLTERLCGRGATDRGDASGTAWWSTRDERYAAEVLDLIQLDRGAAARGARPGATPPAR